ncbi:hypothetical protein L249_1953 [Ophiocordyceps polyrhachis-furcata BCC 54312]|uniref:Serine aminopeptidase S33 domain-containing protein n=1 Tax=Ophiocordyceps polyrhachis-furcata BCC 54312 TaxID=1330021 RepID=A0A367LNG0_9HYPO|nr:hypothetical protein L249_1953 [Ophiocordyceps polyrhachis-furcata BCC 54312]
MAFQTTEVTVTTADGYRLHTKAWEPRDPKVSIAALVWLHGFGDHVDRAASFFSVLASRGIAVHAFDQRGWGRSVHSTSDRGSTGSTETILSDVTFFLDSLRSKTSLPLFLGGHSMGGALVLLWAARGPIESRSAVRGFIAEAPLLRLHPSTMPSRPLVWFARAVAKPFPGFPVRHGQRDAQDPLLRDVVSLRVTLDIWDRGQLVADGLCDLRQDPPASLWLALGNDDQVVCADAVRAYLDRSAVKDKELQCYDGYGHELHNERALEKGVFTNDVVEWIRERSHGPTAAREIAGI